MSALVYVSMLLILVGLYGVLMKVNVLKIALGLLLMVLGVAGLVVSAGGDSAGPVAAVSEAIGLIALVGGTSVVVLLLVTAVRLYEKYGSLDIREMRRLRG